MPNLQREVVVYRGDDVVAMGTYRECAAKLGVRYQTIQYYTSPAYARRLEKRGRDTGRRTMVVKTNV